MSAAPATPTPRARPAPAAPPTPAPDAARRWARAALLGWYDAGHRVLPWRRNAHSRRADGGEPGGAPAGLDRQTFAYRVWVSEVMLQQTRVATVVEYFGRWVARWPTVADLAGASTEEVNEMWAGLGYYRRARFLRDGAAFVVAELGGRLPEDPEGLQRVPGVGAYTAAAIASIAFGHPTAAVDGNVNRVGSRLRAIPGDVTRGAPARALAASAQRLLDPARPGCFNQAVMELGATVCVPNGPPKCAECPVARVCAARAAELAFEAAGGDLSAEGAPRCTRFPEKPEKKKPREETVDVHVVERAGAAGAEYLLVQRPEKGLLAGLWEFPAFVRPPPGGEGGAPGGAGAPAAPGDEALRGDVRGAVAGSLGPGWAVEGPVSEEGELVHVFSHIRQTMVVRRWRAVPGGGAGEGAGEGEGAGGGGEAPRPTQWLTRQGLEDAALTTGVRKVRDLVFTGKGKGGKKGGGPGKGRPAAGDRAAAKGGAGSTEGEAPPGGGKKQGSLLQFFKKAG